MSNPILNKNFGANATIIEGETMSISSTIQKTLIMLVMLIMTASFNWGLSVQGFADKASMLGIGGAIVAFIAIIAMYFSRKASGIFASIYSLAEGLFLGYISYFFEKFYPGIVVQAVGCTFATMFSMLLLYRAGIIKYTEKFRAVYTTLFLSIVLIYVIQFVASLFGRSIPQIFTASPIGIGFSCIVIIIATLGFIEDFGVIEMGAERMAPKYFEWMGAVGLMTSLVWLYVEFLRLLAKLNSRN